MKDLVHLANLANLFFSKIIKLILIGSMNIHNMNNKNKIFNVTTTVPLSEEIETAKVSKTTETRQPTPVPSCDKKKKCKKCFTNTTTNTNCRRKQNHTRKRCPFSSDRKKPKIEPQPKINGLRNSALEANGSIFQDSTDAPLVGNTPDYCPSNQSGSKCTYHQPHSEEFNFGDGDYSHCQSHSQDEVDLLFKKGFREGRLCILELLELDPGLSVLSCRTLCQRILEKITEKPNVFIGFLHGTLQQLKRQDEAED